MITMAKDIYYGLNADLNPEIHLKQEGIINYPTGNKLIYSKDINSKCDVAFTFDYKSHGKIIRLNDLLSAQWVVAPVEGKFYTRLTTAGKVKDFPEVQLSIPELKEDETNILCALHELGHASLTDNLNLMRKNMENNVYDETCGFVSLESKYALQISRTHNFFIGLFGAKNYSKVSERTAWAFALKTMKKLGLLQDLNKKQVQEFYRCHLGTYGNDYL